LNAYGPTEGTIECTHAWVGGGSLKLGDIGKPIPGVRIYILDEREQPVPIGVTGMVWIGGLGVSAGYLVEQKSPSPFALNPFHGGMMYCSGDLGAWREDGNITLLGRKDSQVKIRGYRVELEGLEFVLLEHPSVREAAVLSRKLNPKGPPHLIAVLVSRDGEDESGLAEIRNYLQSRVPAWALPTSIHWLSGHIPLTRNGKVDRVALGRMMLKDEKDSVSTHEVCTST